MMKKQGVLVAATVMLLVFCGALVATAQTNVTTLSESGYGWRFFLKDGKNYVSMPVIPEDASPQAVFPCCEVWAYNSSISQYMYPPSALGEDLEAGRGYLIRCLEHRTVDVHGETAGTITWAMIEANLKDGENLIGPGDREVQIESSHVIVTAWDAVDDEWVILHKGRTLKRGQGYWITK